MRPKRDDTETRDPRGLWKGDVSRAINEVLGGHLPKPMRREEASLGPGIKLEVTHGIVLISRPERSWTHPWRAGTCGHTEEGYVYIL
jgi:hypothetical protein